MPRKCNRLLCVALAMLAGCMLAARSSAADPSFERGAELIRNELRLAATGIRALAVAAHPDDEDGATLSCLRREGCETHICFCTRGEGGQNEAGPEVGVQLAALRTREIDEACAILGAKPWFLNLPDFGFSKSVDETMKVWNHDVALERLVRIIRRVRPHIVITNHNPDGTDHGHHRAAGKLLVEAFDAAADPEKFPAQIKDEGLKAWSISRIYLRRFAADGAAITIDVSKRDGLGGLSASEIGAFALSRHYSQGMLRNLKAGERELRHFSILKLPTLHEPWSATLLDSLAGPFNETPPDQLKLIGAVASSMNAAELENGKLAQSIAARCAAPNLAAETRAHLNRALAEALGLKFEAHADDGYVTAGEKATISLRVANTGALAVKLAKLSFKAESPKWTLSESTAVHELKSGQAENVELEVSAAAGAPLSFPPEEHLFAREESRTPVTARAEFSIAFAEGQSTAFSIEAPVPLDLAAPYSFSLSPKPLLIFTNQILAELVDFKLLVTRNTKGKDPSYLAGKFGPKPQPKIENKEKIVTLASKGDTTFWDFKQMIPEEDLSRGEVTVPTHAWDQNEYYDSPALRVRRVFLEMPANMRVALVKGTDNQTYDALKRMQDAGVAHGTFHVETPTDEELRTTNLNRYQAIVLDIRSTQQRPQIRAMKERLKTFMNDGGTVICLYQKDFDWNDHGKDPARGVGFFRGTGGGGEIAPYPIELSFERITDEAAPVKILDTQHVLMLQPCRITQKDFDGWVQERGAYFPKKWAPEFTPLLSSGDPGEKPLEGGLLVADVGRGAFIYTSYFWHHQLRNGVPGAYRMLVNMLCYSRMKREK